MIEFDSLTGLYTREAFCQRAQELVRSLLLKDDPESDRSILSIAIRLAKMLGLHTIQEGVETKEQVDRLTALGCDCIQGYYFAKPLTKSDFEAFLKAVPACNGGF